MTIALSNITVFALSGGLFMLMSGISWLMLGRPRQGAPLVWCLGGISVGLGSLLVALRGQVDDFWGYVVAQSLYLASFLLLAQSLRIDMHRAWSWRGLVLVLLGYAAVIFWGFPDKQSQDLAVFVRTINFAGLLTLTTTAIALARLERSRNAWFMATGYGAMTVSMAVATLATFSGQASLSAMNRGLFNHLLSWTSLLSMLAIYLGYLGLVLERSLRENISMNQAQWQAQQWRERNQDLALRDRQHALHMLANSLGHTIVQPLTATLLHVQMTRRLLHSGHAEKGIVQEMLAQAEQGIRRAASKIEGIRSFLRPASSVTQMVCLQSVVQDAQNLLSQEMLYRRVDFRVSLPAQELRVLSQALPLTQALVQLLRNAIQAVQDSPRKTITVSLQRSDSQAWVDVADSGPGFSDEMLARSHGGSLPVVDHQGGLGLYMTQSVLAQSGGHMELSNLDAGGAQARIVLPLV
jgi:C4-dicarboxylate-specific signal transduction histidine kinase